MMNTFLVHNLQTKPNIQCIQHNEMSVKISLEKTKMP